MEKGSVGEEKRRREERFEERARPRSCPGEGGARSARGWLVTALSDAVALDKGGLPGSARNAGW